MDKRNVDLFRTTLISTYSEKRRAVGVEIDENYVELAVKRIRRALEKLKLTENKLF